MTVAPLDTGELSVQAPELDADRLLLACLGCLRRSRL